MMKRLVLTVALLATPNAAMAARKAPKLADCPITRTLYGQPGNTGTTAGFTKPTTQSNYASDLVFWLKSGGQTFWYSFSAPNGYGGTNISPQMDPALIKQDENGDGPDDRLPAMKPKPGEDEGEDFLMMFDAFDAKLNAFSSPPQSKDKAPAYLFARELGPLFHYAHNGDLYKLTSPVQIDIALWRPVGCA